MPRQSNNAALNSLVFNNGTAVPMTKVLKTITFTGAAGAGQVGTVAIGTVTGIVEVMIIPLCKTSLTSAGGGTMIMGTATTTNGLMASTTATTLTAKKAWMATTPVSVFDMASAKKYLVSENIIVTIGTGDVTAGVVDFYLCYRPISSDGLIV